MSYIFMDESGDLGFNFKKKRTSRYFVITLLLTNNKRTIEKLVKNVHGNMRDKHKIKSGVLHAFEIDRITRLRFCRQLADKGVRLISMYLDKQQSKMSRKDKHLLYAQIAGKVLGTVMLEVELSKRESIELIVSRRETSKFLNKKFSERLAGELSGTFGLKLNTTIKRPQDEKALQAADIASWAVFRWHEFNDARYYRLLKPILDERPLEL